MPMGRCKLLTLLCNRNCHVARLSCRLINSVIFAPRKSKHNLCMATNRTFTMIKPDAVGAGNSGAITKMIEAAGFKIIAMKKTALTKELAGKFYAIHKER